MAGWCRRWGSRWRAQLDADLSRVKLTANQLTLPIQDGEIVIPVRTYRSESHGDVALFMDIPWFGTADWRTMYDYPARRGFLQHLPAVAIWEISQRRAGIIQNNLLADDAMRGLLAGADSAKWARYAEHLPAADDAQGRQAMIDSTLEDMKPYLEQYQSTPPQERKDEDQAFFKAYDGLRQASQSNRDLAGQIQALRKDLHERAQGRAVLIGWTAAGAMDTVPTSIHPKCPGVVVHGVVFNAIMTRWLWRTDGWWVVAVLTAGVGLLTTGIVAWLTPWKALLCTAGVMGGYTAINCFLQFDYGRTVVGLAAPLIAAVTVWSGLTLSRFVTETACAAGLQGDFRRTSIQRW